MIEIKRELHLHRPGIIARFMEQLGIRDVTPKDLCPPDELEKLYSLYPDLRGDTRSFDKRSETWRDNPGWWKNLL